MSNPVRPHRRQPTRLPHPWDSPGKNTGVGCHCLLQCMKVKSESEVAQLCTTLRDPMDCSPPGFSLHGIFQTRVLHWVAIAFSDTNLKHLVMKNNFNLIKVIYGKYTHMLPNGEKLNTSPLKFQGDDVQFHCFYLTMD